MASEEYLAQLHKAEAACVSVLDGGDHLPAHFVAIVERYSGCANLIIREAIWRLIERGEVELTVDRLLRRV